MMPYKRKAIPGTLQFNKLTAELIAGEDYSTNWI